MAKPVPVPMHDPTPAFARQVLDLYVEALPDVRFPDLELATLQSARDALQVTQLQIEDIEAKLQAARSALEAQAGALHATAERALAYARVFASNDAALHARIAEVGRKKPVANAEGAQPRKRGRPPKSDAGNELFGSEESVALAAEGGMLVETEASAMLEH
jgi:multidrug efflux pump subunit AcrA (membrane-fusion protein)